MSVNVCLVILDKSKYLGAVESVKKYKCMPKQAPDCKEFSAGYWRWDHLYLIDAVKQFGWPSAFITISAREWTFPQVWKTLLLDILCIYIFHLFLGSFLIVLSKDKSC